MSATLDLFYSALIALVAVGGVGSVFALTPNVRGERRWHEWFTTAIVAGLLLGMVWLLVK